MELEKSIGQADVLIGETVMLVVISQAEVLRQLHAVVIFLIDHLLLWFVFRVTLLHFFALPISIFLSFCLGKTVMQLSPVETMPVLLSDICQGAKT